MMRFSIGMCCCFFFIFVAQAAPDKHATIIDPPISTSTVFDTPEGAVLAASLPSILLAYGIHVLDAVDNAIALSNPHCFAEGFQKNVKLPMKASFINDAMQGENFSASQCSTTFTDDSTSYLDGQRFYAHDNNKEGIRLGGLAGSDYFFHRHKSHTTHWQSQSRALLALCNQCEGAKANSWQLYYSSRIINDAFALDFILGKSASQPLILHEEAVAFRRQKVAIQGAFAARINKKVECQFAVDMMQTTKAPVLTGDALSEWDSDKEYAQNTAAGDITIRFETGKHYRIVYQDDGRIEVNNQTIAKEAVNALQSRCDFLAGLQVL